MNDPTNQCAMKCVSGLVVFCMLATANPQAFTDDATRSDAGAVAWILNDHHVSESGPMVCEHAEGLEPAERLQYLKSWVIPGPNAPHLRITADFGHAGNDQPKRPTVVSPALDLIRLAGQLKQLDSLSNDVEQFAVTTPATRCDQLVMLILIALEKNDVTTVEKDVDELLKLVRPDVALLDRSRDGIVLLAEKAIRSKASTTAIRELVLFTTLAYRKEYDRPAWIRHLVAAQVQLSEPDESERSIEGKPQWFVGSLERAFEHGNAFPFPNPSIVQGRYRNQSNYGDDFLFFQSPLRGNYSVNAMATGFGYREAHLLVGGYYAGLVYNHTQNMLGNVRQELRRTSIGEELTDTHRYGILRTRAQVRDGEVVTSINGLEIHRQPISDSAFPWLAVRTNYRVQGGVDNLRITGDPVIPDRIEMIESTELLGWYDYYQDPGNRADQLANWSAFRVQNVTEGITTEIIDPRVGHVPRGSHVEHLLRYIRPMVEDGVIEYEFWCDGLEWMAHPALGRTCYLIREDGVSEHLLTDGRYDRSGLRPDNEQRVNAKDSSRLPLQVNAWNQMQVQRRGNEVVLSLNGQTIHESKIEDEPPYPCFGLFHFADQSSLRVRNARWTGDWPKELPKIEHQQLADDFEGKLDWTASEPAQELIYRIDRDAMTGGRFAQIEGDPARTLVATEEGVVLSQISETGYRGTLMAPDVQVGGDFDIIVSYDQLQCETQLEKIASVRMHLVADTPVDDMALIQWVNDRSNDQMMQCLRMATVNGEQRRNYFGRIPCDGDAGRLRLSRRGDRVFYLAANGDSDYFYLIGEEVFVKEDLEPMGIQFGVQVQGPGGRVNARFTEFEVRAERLEGVSEIDHEASLVSLNKHRDRLPVTLNHDLSRPDKNPNALYYWGDWQRSSSGMKVIASGTDNWTSAGVSLQHLIEGDFDIAFHFDPPKLATPTKGQQTQLYLQIEWSDDDHTQVNAMMTKSDAGTITSRAQTRVIENGNSVYRIIGSQTLSNPDYLRIVRRDDQCFCIAGRKDNQQSLLLGSVRVSKQPIDPRRVRVVLHTGGDGRTSEVLLKSIHVKAAGATLVAPAIIRTVPAKPDTRAPSVFDSIRNFFR
ncbi:signal peptide protein [Rhodopirellula europaea SH398]|uniref:Signal peptide protein n=2 Tax=Rhodopirellula TaxID=265488 RepID=M5S8Q7_9BACT|nr:signal peptide protein [Rhodopirellula europaea SH398]